MNKVIITQEEKQALLDAAACTVDSAHEACARGVSVTEAGESVFDEAERICKLITGILDRAEVIQ